MDDDVIPGAGCAAASDVGPSTATATDDDRGPHGAPHLTVG